MNETTVTCSNGLCKGMSKWVCQNCKIAAYCSAECQKTHWIQHKFMCQAKQSNGKTKYDYDYDNFIFILNLNREWYHHHHYNYLVVKDAVEKSPSFTENLRRLQKNPNDIAEMIGKRIGNNNSQEQLKKLLLEHINLLAEIVNAALQKDSVNQKKNTEKAYKNGEEFALKLAEVSGADKRTLEGHVKKHIDSEITIGEALIKGDIDNAIREYDKGAILIQEFSTIIGTSICNKIAQE